MPARAPDDARPGTGRCFMSRTATGEKRRVFAEEHVAFTEIFHFLRPKTLIHVQIINIFA